MNKEYDNGFRAVTDLDLEINEAEFLVMVGPSGCGKSTTLRMIAGLEDITAGTLKIGNRVVNDLPPKDRDIAMVFQNYALYPHMSVYDNIAFSPQAGSTPQSGDQREGRRGRPHPRVGEPARQAPCSAFRAASASGSPWGAPSFAGPRVFLLDEPLSNLDAKLRVQMRAEITDLQREVGVTTLLRDPRPGGGP